MTAFDIEDEFNDNLGYRLLMNSPVTLFYRHEVLDSTAASLAALGYQIRSFDAGSWRDEQDLHQEVAAKLDFPKYYGRNYAALNDCLRDLVLQEYGWDPESTGLVLVFTGFDAFAHRLPEIAHGVLHLAAHHSRAASLIGSRLICLVQSSDPWIRFDDVGAEPVVWNAAEWLNSAREPERRGGGELRSRGLLSAFGRLFGRRGHAARREHRARDRERRSEDE